MTKSRYAAITKLNDVYSDSYKKRINILSEQNPYLLNIKVGGKSNVVLCLTN
jgi:hypothetical protein